MSLNPGALFNRDMLVTTVVLGAAAMATYYFKSSKSGIIASSRVVSAGTIQVHPQLEHVKEYERDFHRFFHNGCVYVTPGGSSMPTIPHHVSDVTKFNTFDLFFYGLSASFLMDAVHALKVSPPVIHQPVMIVGPEGVAVLGFIGAATKGDRPDRKYTNQGIRIRWSFGKQDECLYEIFRVKKGAKRSIDLIE